MALCIVNDIDSGKDLLPLPELKTYTNTQYVQNMIATKCNKVAELCRPIGLLNIFAMIFRFDLVHITPGKDNGTLVARTINTGHTVLKVSMILQVAESSYKVSTMVAEMAWRSKEPGHQQS